MIIRFLLNNIRTSFGNYIGYICTTAFSVFVFYIFSTITLTSYSSDLLTATTSSIQPFFSLASSIIYMFAFIFIAYASGYFIRMRYRDIALYTSLGFEKHHLIFIIVTENIVINLTALAIGLLVGIVSTHFFTLLLYYLIQVSSTQVPVLFFNAQAFDETWITFIIFFIISAIFTIIRIYALTNEKLKARMAFKKPIRGSIIMTIISLILLFGSYYWVFLYPKNDLFLLSWLLILGGVVTGTFLFCNYGTGIIIRIIKNTRYYLLNAKHFIAISNLQYQLRNYTRFLGVFATLSTIALVMIIVTTAFYQNIDNAVANEFPFAYIYETPASEQTNEQLLNLMNNNGENRIKEIKTADFILVPNTNFTFESKYNESNKNYILPPTNLLIFPLSTYNTFRDKEPLDLSKTQSIFINSSVPEERSEPQMFTAVLGNMQLQTVVKNDSNFLSGFLYGYGSSRSLIVNDELYAQLSSQYQPISFTTVYYPDNSNLATSFTQVQDIFNENNINYDSILFSYQSYLDYGGTMLFTCYLLAILFLLTIAAILYFKLVADGRQNSDYYQDLYAMGMSKQQIIGSIQEQFRFIFILPCTMAIIHTSLAIYLFNFLLRIVFSSLSLMTLLAITIVSIIGFIFLFWIIYRLVLRSYTKRIFKNTHFNSSLN